MPLIITVAVLYMSLHFKWELMDIHSTNPSLKVKLLAIWWDIVGIFWSMLLITLIVR